MSGQALYFEGRVLYGQTKNKFSPFGTYTDSFDTERLLAKFKVASELEYDRTTLMPSMQLSYTTDDQKAYTDGLGNACSKPAHARISRWARKD